MSGGGAITPLFARLLPMYTPLGIFQCLIFSRYSRRTGSFVGSGNDGDTLHQLDICSSLVLLTLVTGNVY